MRSRIIAIAIAMFAVLAASASPASGLVQARSQTGGDPSGVPVALNLTTEQWAGLPDLIAQNAWYDAVNTATWYDNYNARNGDRDAIHRVIARVWGPDTEWAYRIVSRESGFDAGATNRSSGACGLFQMLGHEDMFRAAGFPGQCHDPVANAIVAHNLYASSGRAPWSLN